MPCAINNRPLVLEERCLISGLYAPPAAIVKPNSSASSQSTPPSPHTDHPGCPTPSKNNPCTRAFSQSQTSAPNPRVRLYLSRRPLPFPSHAKCCTRVRTSPQFPGTHTPLHTPPAYSQNPAAHAATRCSPSRSLSPGRTGL